MLNFRCSIKHSTSNIEHYGSLRLRPGRGEVLFGKTDQLLEPRGILDRHVGQDLPVQEDIGLLQGINKPAIGQSMRPNCRVDAGNPQHAEIPFPVFPSGIGVCLTLIY